ncbi:hypothetical protein B484DRAFT_425622 [Ochromonadaceae sp. CCMP2298]|nr:hypothetical protein B484DRAFT_425622 [Ochromonadaceae sp. CCMP2298]
MFIHRIDFIVHLLHLGDNKWPVFGASCSKRWSAGVAGWGRPRYRPDCRICRWGAKGCTSRHPSGPGRTAGGQQQLSVWFREMNRLL